MFQSRGKCHMYDSFDFYVCGLIRKKCKQNFVLMLIVFPVSFGIYVTFFFFHFVMIAMLIIMEDILQFYKQYKCRVHTKISTKCLCYLSVLVITCVTSTDESLCWCNSRYPDRLFNHPPSASKPFPSGKARRQCEPSSWCVSWVILQHIQTLAVCINTFDKWRGKMHKLSHLQPCVHNKVIRFAVLKCLSSLFLSCNTRTRVV